MAFLKKETAVVLYMQAFPVFSQFCLFLFLLQMSRNCFRFSSIPFHIQAVLLNFVLVCYSTEVQFVVQR